MSSEDVSTVDVKLELRADSRKRHCRMMIRDSTSEAARERKTRALREITSDDFQQEAEFDDEDAGSHEWPLEAIRAVLLVVLP